MARMMPYSTPSPTTAAVVSRATTNSRCLTARMRRIPATSMSSTAIMKTTAARAETGK